jgi:hypothetical protein
MADSCCAEGSGDDEPRLPTGPRGHPGNTASVCAGAGDRTIATVVTGGLPWIPYEQKSPTRFRAGLSISEIALPFSGPAP